MAVAKQDHQTMVKALVFKGRRDLGHAVCFFIMRRTRDVQGAFIVSTIAFANT